MSKRRKVSHDFKQETNKLTRMIGVGDSQIAKDPGIGANRLTQWRREQEKDGNKAFQGQARDEEMIRL